MPEHSEITEHSVFSVLTEMPEMSKMPEHSEMTEVSEMTEHSEISEMPEMSETTEMPEIRRRARATRAGCGRSLITAAKYFTRILKLLLLHYYATTRIHPLLGEPHYLVS